MPSQNSKPPKPRLSQALQQLGHLFQQGALTILEWQIQQREAEKREVAHAQFLWGGVLLCLIVHSVLGLMVSVLSGVGAIAVGVLIIGSSFYCTLISVYQNIFPDGFICYEFWMFLTTPLCGLVAALEAVMKRWIFSTRWAEWMINLCLDGVSTFCFLMLLGLNSLGLGTGYWLGTQLVTLIATRF